MRLARLVKNYTTASKTTT